MGRPVAAWSIFRKTAVSKPDERHFEESNATVAELLFQGSSQAAAATLGRSRSRPLAWHSGLTDSGRRCGRRASNRTQTGTRPQSQTSSLPRRGVTWPMPRRGSFGRRLSASKPRRFLISSDKAPARSCRGECGWRQLGRHCASRRCAAEGDRCGAGISPRLLHGDSLVAPARRGPRLPSSPAVALARAAAGRRAVLVIDQLDAVSLASGRAPEMYPVVDELLREAARFGVQVVLACRRYDIDNDQRLDSCRASGRTRTRSR